MALRRRPRPAGQHVPVRASPTKRDQARLRFTQGYGVELDDDAYGIYNFNWGYYLESLRLLCGTGTGKPYRA
jgi:hypothetical protein